MSPMIGSVAGPLGSPVPLPGPSELGAPPYVIVSVPCDSPSGVVAVTACADEGTGWSGSSEQIVGSEVTVVCWRWLPLMWACTHWNACALRRCHVAGRFWARLWPTSATATLTGHSLSRRLRYLNSRKDSTASKRSSLQPWIEKTATSRLPTSLVHAW